MMKHPLVSILIPVYNREKFIGECIASALAQTYANIEVVIVDNASTDRTWEICEQFVEKDRRVRVFRNATNIGPVRNWKRCAEEAKGEFTKVLFSDDCLEPNCLSVMVPKLEDLSVALVYCAARIGKTREESILAYSTDESAKLSPSQFINLVIRGAAPVSPGAILIRTSDFLKNLHTQFPTSTPRPFEKHGAGPDVMISLFTVGSYSYVINISEPLVYFRAHADSFSIGNTGNQVSNGYRSAISFFLLKKHGRKPWIEYLSYDWLQQMRTIHRWINPRLQLIEYEGKGSVREILAMCFCSFRQVADKFIGNKHCFVKE